MGCWNKTCGLSNLHITAGTPVYVFVLEKNKSYDHCYSTSLFSPLLLPFESVYDDYGGGEDSSGPALPIIMGALKRQLVEMEVGENQYHDIAVKRDDFTPEKFFEAVHEDRMFIQYGSEQRPIYFTMFRKDIMDHILENRRIEDYVGDNKGTIAKWGDSKDYIQYKFEDIAASVRPLLAKMIEDTEGQEPYLKAFIMDRVHKYRNDFPAAKWLNGDSYRYSRIVDIKQYISKAVEIGTLDAVNKVEPIVIEHLKAVFLDGFMHAARKTWIPGGHEGSQGMSGGALRLLAKATINALDKEHAEWLADMGEEAEDEYIEE
jgi:hypothetical protein